MVQRSSVVEQSAVNRSVVGSSPTAGAIKKDPIWGLFFMRPLQSQKLTNQFQYIIIMTHKKDATI